MRLPSHAAPPWPEFWNEPTLREYRGGDFNAHEHASQITQMRRTWLEVFRYLHPNGDGATHELRLPWRSQASRRRLDYIFFYPGNCQWKVLEACHLDALGGPHLDHRAVLAKIAVDL